MTKQPSRRDALSRRTFARHRFYPIFKLLVASATIALVWGIALPWIAKRPMVERRSDFLDDRGIDPSAMFYTELEMMDEILQRIEGHRTPATHKSDL